MTARQQTRSNEPKATTRPRPRPGAARAPTPNPRPAPFSSDDEVEVDESSVEVPEGDRGDDNLGLGLGLGADASRPPLKEDPALDRRIIEGMLKDRKVLLEELAKEGMSQNMVLRRAAELGLSEALLRQVKGVAADLAGERPGRRPMPSSLGARTCLSCDRVFLSTGPGNRLCMRCRGGDAGLAQF